MIQNIFIYPLKSGQGISQQEMPLTTSGLMFDRILLPMSVKTSSLISGKMFPKLFEIFLKVEGNFVMIGIPNVEKIFKVDISFLYKDKTLIKDSKITKMKVNNGLVDVITIEDPELNTELSKYFEEETNLVIPLLKLNPSPLAKEDQKANEEIYFSKVAPLLVTSVESLEYINKLLKDKNEPPVNMLNFRPNLVLSFPSQNPFWEDKVTEISIGRIKLKRVANCLRCKVVTFDVEERRYRKSQEPLGLLAEVNFDEKDEGVVFGQYFRVEIEDMTKDNKLIVGNTVGISK